MLDLTPPFARGKDGDPIQQHSALDVMSADDVRRACAKDSLTGTTADHVIADVRFSACVEPKLDPLDPTCVTDAPSAPRPQAGA